MGAAIAKSGMPREELFFVSKIWVSNYRYEDAKASIDESLCKLGTDYLGLMLLHQAYHDVCGAWRALEEAYAEGKVRAIGVSNFDSKQLMDICAFADVAPMLNQVETRVFWQERPEHAVMERLGVQHMAWGPFAEGANGFFANPLLAEIGKKYGKGVGQVALRFLMDEGVVVIPKSSKPARMTENFASSTSSSPRGTGSRSARWTRGSPSSSIITTWTPCSFCSTASRARSTRRRSSRVFGSTIPERAAAGAQVTAVPTFASRGNE